jgi:hypothetical protein
MDHGVDALAYKVQPCRESSIIQVLVLLNELEEKPMCSKKLCCLDAPLVENPHALHKHIEVSPVRIR